MRCFDCGVCEGELHLDGCDKERCGKCGRQVLAFGLCENTKREPYFKDAGFWCQRCGKNLPNMLMVTDECWKNIIAGNYKDDEVLCIECMRFIAYKKGIKFETKEDVRSN